MIDYSSVLCVAMAPKRLLFPNCRYSNDTGQYWIYNYVNRCGARAFISESTERTNEKKKWIHKPNDNIMIDSLKIMQGFEYSNIFFFFVEWRTEQKKKGKKYLRTFLSIAMEKRTRRKHFVVGRFTFFFIFSLLDNAIDNNFEYSI